VTDRARSLAYVRSDSRNALQRELYGPKHHRRRREFARRIERGKLVMPISKAERVAGH
jgi:hypothetical protein